MGTVSHMSTSDREIYKEDTPIQREIGENCSVLFAFSLKKVFLMRSRVWRIVVDATLRCGCGSVHLSHLSTHYLAAFATHRLCTYYGYVRLPCVYISLPLGSYCETFRVWTR